MNATTDVCVVRDGVTGADLDWPATADAEGVLQDILGSMWEDADGPQVMVCAVGGSVAWVLMAPVPVRGEGDTLTGHVGVLRPSGWVESYRVTYHLGSDGWFERSEVVRVG